MKKRLDVILTERGLFESRLKAVMAINANIVSVGGKIIAKPSEKVEEDAEIKNSWRNLKVCVTWWAKTRRCNKRVWAKP